MRSKKGAFKMVLAHSKDSVLVIMILQDPSQSTPHPSAALLSPLHRVDNSQGPPIGTRTGVGMMRMVSLWVLQRLAHRELGEGVIYWGQRL